MFNTYIMFLYLYFIILNTIIIFNEFNILLIKSFERKLFTKNNNKNNKKYVSG